MGNCLCPPPPPPHDFAAPSGFAGFLKKKGHFNKSMKDRIFSLDKGRLEYYEKWDEKTQTPINRKGFIYVSDYSISSSTKSGEELDFILDHSSGVSVENMHLRPKDAAERAEWIQYLESHITYYAALKTRKQCFCRTMNENRATICCNNSKCKIGFFHRKCLEDIQDTEPTTDAEIAAEKGWTCPWCLDKVKVCICNDNPKKSKEGTVVCSNNSCKITTRQFHRSCLKLDKKFSAPADWMCGYCTAKLNEERSDATVVVV